MPILRKASLELASRLEEIASHPMFGGGTAVVTIMAGAMASFLTDDIKANVTPFWACSTFSIKASLFWGCIFLAGFLLGAGQWAQNRRISRSAGRLEGMVKRLHTLPADGYLPSYQSCYRVAASNAFLVTQSTESTVTQIEATIRVVLGAILETARDFDKSPEAIYFGNVMIWRPKGEGIEAISPLHIVPFIQGDPRVAGVIELIPELSTSTLDENEYNKDSNIKPIVFQIPSDPTPVFDGRMMLKYPILPGAPLAFVNKVFASYENIAKLFLWLDTKCGLDAITIDKIRNYFHTGDGKHIRSFGSIPILLPSEDADKSDDDPIGILNLHSTQENILEDNGQTLFAPLLEPFLMLLSILILKRNEAMSKVASLAYNGEHPHE